VTEDELQEKAVDLCERLWKLGVRTDDAPKWDVIGLIAPVLFDALRDSNTDGYSEGHADGVKGRVTK
jgi:hypothetical protein